MGNNNDTDIITCKIQVVKLQRADYKYIVVRCENDSDNTLNFFAVHPDMFPVLTTTLQSLTELFWRTLEVHDPLYITKYRLDRYNRGDGSSWGHVLELRLIPDDSVEDGQTTAPGE